MRNTTTGGRELGGVGITGLTEKRESRERRDQRGDQAGNPERRRLAQGRGVGCHVAGAELEQQRRVGQSPRVAAVDPHLTNNANRNTNQATNGVMLTPTGESLSARWVVA
jgi:hypothetical protein